MVEIATLVDEIHKDIQFVETLSDKSKEQSLYYSENTLHKMSMIKKYRNASIDKKLKLLELMILNEGV